MRMSFTRTVCFQKKPRTVAKEAKFYTLADAKRLIEAAYGTKYEAMVALAIGAGRGGTFRDHRGVT